MAVWDYVQTSALYLWKMLRYVFLQLLTRHKVFHVFLSSRLGGWGSILGSPTVRRAEPWPRLSFGAFWAWETHLVLSSSQNQPHILHSVPPLWHQELPVRRTASRSVPAKLSHVVMHRMANNMELSIHQLLSPTKMLSMKRRHSHCIFALPQWHCNLYKRLFVLQNFFEVAY